MLRHIQINIGENPGCDQTVGSICNPCAYDPSKTVSSSCVPLGIERERAKHSDILPEIPSGNQAIFTNVLSMFNNANFHAGDVWAPYLPKK